MCHVCVSSASGCALGNFTEHAAWNTAVQELYFHPAGPEARKSGSDAAGTAVLFKVLYCKIKSVSLPRSDACRVVSPQETRAW